MYRKSKSIHFKKNLHSFYLFHVLFSQSITNSARNVHNVCGHTSKETWHPKSRLNIIEIREEIHEDFLILLLDVCKASRSRFSYLRSRFSHLRSRSSHLRSRCSTMLSVVVIQNLFKEYEFTVTRSVIVFWIRIPTPRQKKPQQEVTLSYIYEGYIKMNYTGNTWMNII